MADNVVLYGFVGLESHFSEKLEDVNVQVIDDAIRLTLEEHNRQIQAMTGDLFAFTEQYKVRFQQPGSGTLQPLDEWGNPLPTRPAGFYDVAFPIQGGGDAYGNNRVTRALQTVADVNRHIADILTRDADWMKRHALAAIFDNTTWSFDDPEHGTLTIEPLANGDTVKYPKRSGTVATDTHHLAQAAAVADATNPFDDIYTDLAEHPVNAGGQVVAYIPSNIKADVEGLAGFTEIGDPDITPGANTATVNGRIDRGWGDEVIGKVNKVWIVEAGILPNNYIVANVRGGGAPVLRAREYPAQSLKGLFRESHSPDGNLLAQRFIRYAGFGAYNRVGAMVYFVEAGDTTYDIPSGYTNPLAV